MIRGSPTTLKTYAAWVEQADGRAAETIATIVPRPQPLAGAPRGPYESIAETLRDDIVSGRFKPGEALPSVVQLAAQLTVAAGTAPQEDAPSRRKGATLRPCAHPV